MIPREVPSTLHMWKCVCVCARTHVCEGDRHRRGSSVRHSNEERSKDLPSSPGDITQCTHGEGVQAQVSEDFPWGSSSPDASVISKAGEVFQPLRVYFPVNVHNELFPIFVIVNCTVLSAFLFRIHFNRHFKHPDSCFISSHLTY